MNAWPYVVIVILLVGMLFLSMRRRKRQVAEEMVRASRIGVGTEVMTTSGLYGTVVAKNEDGTVLLSVAPGVEVKWASAALRDAASLADPYRRALAADAETDPEAESAAGAGGEPAAGPRAADPASGVELKKNGDGHAET